MHEIVAALTAIVGPPDDVDISHLTTVNVHETAPGVVRVIAYSTSANSTAIIAQYFSPVPILRVNHNLTTSNRGKHTHTFLLLVIPRA